MMNQQVEMTGDNNTGPTEQMETQAKEGINILRFKSPLIHTSRKKLIYVTRYIKGLTLKQANMFFLCLNKRYALPMSKFIRDVINNLVYRLGIDKEEAIQKTIRYIVLEKSKNKIFGLRYAAKGRAFRSLKVSTRVNMYVN